MKRWSPLLILLVLILSAELTACKKDSTLSASGQSFVEEFDTLQNAYNRGWRLVNRSVPIGRSNWRQGSASGDLTAYSSRGTNTGFLSTDFGSTSADVGVISNWIISPSLVMQNGDKIVFYTRSSLIAASPTDSTDFGNRLQVRLNAHNDSINAGNGSDPGQFDNMILDINPTYQLQHSDPFLSSPNAYPARWKKYEAVVAGLNAPARGRFALRYFIEQGGPAGRGSEVGIDSVAYVGK